LKKLGTMDESAQLAFAEEFSRKKKSPALAFWLLLPCGLHYAYAGRVWLTLIFLITFGGFGVWWFLDLFRVWGIVRERMECSERTVRRCMDHLRDHEKWPIDPSKTGYSLREPSLAETRITAPQQVAALAMVHEALRLLGVSKLALEIRGELAKVCRRSEALGEIRWDELGEVIQQRAPSGDISLNHAIHGKLTLAILQQQVVEIRYRRLEEDHHFSRSVFPQRLICRDQYWYLIAWDMKAEDQRLEDLAPDRLRVHFRLSELVEVKSWVLGFGGAATVIAPEELRELVGEEVEAMKLNLQTMNPPDAIHPDDAKR
jgi:predicted DNA-binding transcriptional regulator YafY